jgi:hypothetical protein
MTRSLTATLADHEATDITVRVVNGFFSVLPFAPSWAYPGTLEQAAARQAPELAARVAARAELLGREAGPQAALAAFDFLDKGDAGIALFSGVRGAFKAYQGDRAAALEMDPQQAADAGLKAVGLAYATWKLFSGSADDKARALASTEAGRALMIWYVATDVVLPFADNFATGGTELITTLIDDQAAANAARLAAVAGPEVEEAAGMLTKLSGTLKGFAGQAATFATPLSQYAQQTLPGILATADKVSGVAATGVDALSSYRCLGAALVAEVVVARALTEVRAEVAAEQAEADRQRAEAEAEALNARIAADEAAAAKRAADEAERKRAADEAERARLDAERAHAEAQRAKIEAEERKAAAVVAESERGKQREDYTLDEAEGAASLKANPIKVTRGAEVAPVDAAPPAKAGCMGCGAGLLLFLVASGAVGVSLLA